MKKSKGTAVASFVFGLLFWIPLINLISGVLAVYLGIKSLIKIKKEPNKYGGKRFAITGIMLGCFVYLLYLSGIVMCLLGSKEICKNISLSFLA